MIPIDTNIFARFYVDEPDHTEAANSAFCSMFHKPKSALVIIARQLGY